MMGDVLLFPSGDKDFPGAVERSHAPAGEGQGVATLPSPPAHLSIEDWLNCQPTVVINDLEIPPNIHSTDLVTGKALRELIKPRVTLWDETMTGTDTLPSEVHEPEQLRADKDEQPRNAEGQFCSVADFKAQFAKQEEMHNRLHYEIYGLWPRFIRWLDRVGLWFKQYSKFFGWGGFALAVIWSGLMSGAWAAIASMGL